MTHDKDRKSLNVPPLRFPGFTDEWEKITLGELGDTMIGLTYSPKDVVETGGTIVFRSSNIQGGMIDYLDLVRVSKPIKERIVTKKNDILICARNGSQRLIGKNTLLKESDAGNTFGAFMMVYRSDDNDIVHPLLSTKRYISQVSENLGARINQITTSDLNSFEFYLPQESEEKRKIGRIFALINERIATQNKIIDNLQSLIKGLAKTHYENCHRLHSVKIQNLGKSYTVMNLSKEQLSDCGQPCILYGELFTQYGPIIDEIVSKTNVTGNLTLSSGQDLLFPSSTTVDAQSLIAPSALTKSNIILGGDMFGIIVSDEYSPEYLSYYFNYIGKHDLAKYAIGSTIIHLHYKDIAEHTIIIPNINEQKAFVRLASFVKGKIDVEKKLLNNLTELKTYLLQKLFI